MKTWFSLSFGLALITAFILLTPQVEAQPRATLTPEPSPYFQITVKNTQGAAQDLTGSRVCSGTWQGQITPGNVVTSNCVTSPASSFTIPADRYRSFGNFSGVFFKIPSGWTLQSVTSPTFGGFANTIATDERGETGPVYGWAVTSLTTGVRNINVTVQQPPSYGYIKQGNIVQRVSYYSGQAATTACTNVTTIVNCSAPPVTAGSALAQCTLNGTTYPIYANGMCPSPTLAPSNTPIPASPTTQVTVKPTTCAMDCSFNNRGDANCDLAIDSTDWNIWASKFKGEKAFPNFNADFNKDGKISMVDAQIWVQGFYNPPDAPGTSCVDKQPTPTAPVGCNYRQVQCVKAPCPALLVCDPEQTPIPSVTQQPGPTTALPTDIPEPTEIPLPTNTPGPSPTLAPISGQAYYIAPNGSDTNNGTSLTTPFKTFAKALPILKPGDVLYMREGVYVENIKSVKLTAGRADAKITVKNYQNERPVVQGLFWMSGATHWIFDGINITWGSGAGSGDHMVKFTGGADGWVLRNCEIWGARSYAAISITGFTKNWTVQNCVIHDTYKSNDTNQDHLIYVNDASYGVIERNVFINSENGRGVKLGPPSSGGAGPNNITIRYNTFYNNTGPANIQLSGGTSSTTIERNILVKPQTGKNAITENDASGANNAAANNLAWQAAGVGDFIKIRNGGGNVNNIDPQINFNVAKRSDGSYIIDSNSFKPGNSQATEYGKYAP